MERKAKIIRISEDQTRAIAVDVDTYEVLLEYINRNPQHRKKFNYIVEIILQGLRNTDVYDKEEINKKCKGVTAMKLFKGRSNDRIYCKEVVTEEKVFVVITAELLEKKKTQGLTKIHKQLIEKVGSYAYEIIP